MNNDHELLLRYLGNDLSAKEIADVESRLSNDEVFRAQLSQLSSVTNALDNMPEASFGPFFVDRTLRALKVREGMGVVTSYDALRWAFLRTAVSGLAIVVILAAWNLVDYQALGLASNWVETAFGLPSTTMQDAFYFGFI